MFALHCAVFFAIPVVTFSGVDPGSAVEPGAYATVYPVGHPDVQSDSKPEIWRPCKHINVALGKRVPRYTGLMRPSIVL